MYRPTRGMSDGPHMPSVEVLRPTGRSSSARATIAIIGPDLFRLLEREEASPSS